MKTILRAGPATQEACPTLAEDLLRGADEIAKFIFGDAKHRRKVYYLTGEAAKGLPHFKIGVNGRVKVSQRAAQNVTTLGLVRSPRE